MQYLLWRANSGGNDLFLLKYSTSDNTKQWTRLLGTSSDEFVYAVELDSSNNVYVIGDTAGNLDGTNSGGKDVFLVKYNSSGTKQWTKQLGSSSDDIAQGIAIDNSSNIYVVGYTDGELDGSANSGDDDYFIIKYDSNGNKQ